MTVTITGTVADVTSRKDSRGWRVWSPVYRQGVNGEIITITEQPVRVHAGLFTAELEPGVAVIQSPDGDQWTVTVPETDADLWELIATAVAFPPDTSAEALASAVTTYLTDNPVVTMLTAGLIDATEAGRAVLTGNIFKQLARTPDALIAGTVTRNSDGAATSAPVVWPDGTPGTYTALTLSTTFPGAVDSYKVTYGSPVSKTYTQPAVTRDATGATTVVPGIVVS